MKTFFVTLASGMEIKNWMLGVFYELARKKDDARLVFFVSPEKLESCRQAFSAPNCILEPLVDLRLGSRRFKEGFRIVALASIPTETIRFRQETTYAKGGSLAGLFIKRFFWFLGHTRSWRAILRLAEYYLFHEDRAWKEYFDKYKPDAVFATALLLEEDTSLIKYAKRRGIPTLGIPRSWDNFTSKLFLRVFPDILLVQNHRMVEEATKLCDYPKNRTRVIGLPQFDHYRDPSWYISKRELARIFSIDSEKRWISYFTGGLPTVVLAEEDYSEQIEMLKQALDDGRVSHATLILRPHPNDISTMKERFSKTIPVLDFGKGFDFSHEDVKLLINLIRASAVVVILGSTIALEAAIFDRPTVLAAFNGYRDEKIQWYNKLSVALDHTTHYVDVQKTGALWRVTNEREFIEAVKTYFEKPELHHASRARLVEELIEPLDGKAGERAFKILMSLASW